MATSYTNVSKPSTTSWTNSDEVTGTLKAGNPIGLLLLLTYSATLQTATSYTNETKP